MKKPFLLFIFLVLFIFNGKGQNLVPNGDFEQYSSCPDYLGQLDSALFWINPNQPQPVGASPDYFNQCSPNFANNVPANNFGFQPAHSGSGYCGGIFWYGGPTPNYRENFETPLSSALTANQCYHFEMYVALAEKSNHTTSSIGIYFSNTLISGISNYFPLPFTPQITNSTGFVTDTLSWTLISGNYTASGGESFLIIGNFNDDANTPLQQTNFSGTFQEAYFFIDDVSLTPCTSIEEQNKNDAIKIYPNPVKDELTIDLPGFRNLEDLNNEIKITDVLGKVVYRNQVQTLNFKLQTSNFKTGIYFVEINDGKNVWRKKFLKVD